MIVTTTPNVEGKQIVEYKQVVFGEVIAGANFMRDFFAGITDVIGGRLVFMSAVLVVRVKMR